MIASQTTKATTSDDVPPAHVTQERPTPVSHPSETSLAPGEVEPAAAPAIPEVVESPAAKSVGELAVPFRPCVAVPELAAERQSPYRPKRMEIVLEEV